MNTENRVKELLFNELTSEEIDLLFDIILDYHYQDCKLYDEDWNVEQIQLIGYTLKDVIKTMIKITERHQEIFTRLDVKYKVKEFFDFLNFEQ